MIQNQEVLSKLSKKEKQDFVEEYLIQEDDEEEEELMDSGDGIIEALESEFEESYERSEILDESQTSQSNSQRKKYPKKRLKEAISCPKCDRQFFYKAYFQFHYKDVHREDREEICQYCGKVFKNSRRLNSHLVVHQKNATEKRHKCDVCDKQFHFSGDLARHKRVHDNIKPFKCHICPKSFIQSYALKLHIDVHNRVRFCCDICGSNFSGKPTLKRHVIKCISGNSGKSSRDNATGLKGKEKYKCLSSECDRQFSSRKYLGMHLEKSHSITFQQFETTCLDCLRVFDNTGDYSSHVKTHSCNFICELCKLRFRTEEKLSAHMEKTHKEGEKRPFVCTICDAKFKRVEHLKGHIDYKHSDTRKLQCEFCELKFRQRGELNVHIRVHRNENPFSCWQCNHSCKTSSNLRQHMSLVHNENCIYYCKLCQKSFRYSTDLNQHNKDHVLIS